YRRADTTKDRPSGNTHIPPAPSLAGPHDPRSAPAGAPVARLTLSPAALRAPARHAEEAKAGRATLRNRRQELHACRRRHRRQRARWFQPAVAGVDAADEHRVRVLVADRQILTGAIDAEMTRPRSARALLFDPRQPAGPGIGREQHDAVVAAVRCVQPFPRRVQL